MTRQTFPPIAFDARAVATMIRVALHFNPRFAPGFSAVQLRLMATGRMKPRPSVLLRLNLTEDAKGGYLWNLK